jgi:hypothetical protein
MKADINIADLPAVPEGKTGWPWTEGSAPLPEADYPSMVIVMPSYNQGEYLEQCIRSVLLQGYPNLQFFLRDGGSTDCSQDIIRTYAEWIDDWFIGPDGGQCSAINSVLLEAEGTLAGWMNTDDFYMPNALQHLAEASMANPEHVLWAGNTEEIDIEDQHVRFYPPKMGEVHEIAQWYINYGFHQPSSIFSLDLFKQLGGLDPKIETCLDVELWIRMRMEGSFGTTEHTISTVRNNPEAKAFKFARRQIVELLSMMYRNDLLDAALWRLDEFAKMTERIALQNIREKNVDEEILYQFTSKELLDHVAKRTKRKIAGGHPE